MVIKLSSCIHLGPLFSLKVEFLLGLLGYQNRPRVPLLGVRKTGGYLGSFSVDRTPALEAVIFLRTFHEECDPWQQGRQATARLHALCSLGMTNMTKAHRGA